MWDIRNGVRKSFANMFFLMSYLSQVCTRQRTCSRQAASFSPFSLVSGEQYPLAPWPSTAGDFQAVWECTAEDSRESEGTQLIIALWEVVLFLRWPRLRKLCVPSHTQTRNELDRNMIMLPERDLVYSPGWLQMWDPKCLDYRHVPSCLAFRQKHWVENKSFRWHKQWQQWVTLIWNNILGTIFSQLPNKWHHLYPPPSTENCLFAHELLKDKLPNNPFFSLEILDDVMAVEFIAKILLPSQSTQHLLPGQRPQVPLPTTCPRAKGTLGRQFEGHGDPSPKVSAPPPLSSCYLGAEWTSTNYIILCFSF